ncbi:phosphoribosylformylglycinamidine synthase subunit PurS [Lacticaseibacillus sharpeae]|uniref:Phosphoribosylformylglycinamidine synthase subunit PurS n=1 Tax=Lacticaseibacillus sharpeae JCM 1186 = DSM 20505 TaxID=1291052 RepID=A0A0R1ZHQ6_9LACO|nr:phosphoribosylformylglycinamidine synthase subunit PurS [Lacticaseibacillus sharpeae]KRM54528.1 hypothetical protein FC18_GL000334 [Lacticaseibacillus sharpeae JCM 1186 = DSM 20505]
MFKAAIYVNYKPSVLDPKAEAIKTALTRMDYHNVTDVVFGKYFEIVLDAADAETARTQVDHICDELLANVNMETYRFDLTEVSGVHA